jgi:hypothetical protein
MRRYQPNGMPDQRCDLQGCDDIAEVYIEVISNESESAYYIRTCLSHIFQQINFAQTLSVSGCRAIRVANVVAEDQKWRILQGCY